MRVNVLYFGQIAEKTGKSAEEVVLENDAKVSELQSLLIRTYPALQALSYKIALNQSIAKADEPLTDGAEIAILPPYAGG